jgi:DNA invertase Pin-like site-specific DNA recombinase
VSRAPGVESRRDTVEYSENGRRYAEGPVGKRVAVYARVSTLDQSCEPQLRDLREYVVARGWLAVEYIDQGVSGARDRRPALDKLLAAVKARKVDVVVVAAFDRFGRSVRHLVETLELFRHYGVEFVSLREAIDTGSPLGQAVFTIIAAIAQLERSLIAERVRAGLRRARAEGKRLGRPRVQVDAVRLESAVRRGLSVRDGARELGVSASSYARLARDRLIKGTLADVTEVSPMNL